MTPEDKARLRALITSKDWQIVENIRLDYCRMLQARPKTRATIDETAMTTAREEGMVEGIANFNQELFNQAK